MEAKAIIVGTSTGIGRALAFKLAREGYEVGLTGRSEERLRNLQEVIPTKTYVKEIDVGNTDTAIFRLEQLIEEMGGLDLIVINAGIRKPNAGLEWGPELETFKVNAMGFAALANVAFRYFLRQDRGHLVGVSSIASLRGSGESPAYNATKAFMSNYLDGLRLKALPKPIYVTDLIVGFVDTEMNRGRKSMSLAVSPERAADLIYQSIQKRKRRVFIPLRWLFLISIFQSLPDAVSYWLYWKFTDRPQKAPLHTE